jgi:hypothetical protein
VSKLILSFSITGGRLNTGVDGADVFAEEPNENELHAPIRTCDTKRAVPLEARPVQELVER